MFEQFIECKLYDSVRQNEMFVNFCIGDKKRYLRARMKQLDSKKLILLSEYHKLGGDYERDVEIDISKDTALEWDESDNVGDERLEVINPYENIDTSGDDLRHLYASVLWYLACVRSIEALNALTIDVRRYGRKKWILKQLSLWETLVRRLFFMMYCMFENYSHAAPNRLFARTYSTISTKRKKFKLGYESNKNP